MSRERRQDLTGTHNCEGGVNYSGKTFQLSGKPSLFFHNVNGNKIYEPCCKKLPHFKINDK